MTLLIVLMISQLPLNLSASTFLFLFLTAVLLGLIFFLAGIWLRPRLEQVWSRFFQQKRIKDPSPRNLAAIKTSPNVGVNLPHPANLLSPKISPSPPVIEPAPTAAELEYIRFEYHYRQQLINKWEKKDFWMPAHQQPLPLHREDFFVKPRFQVAGSAKSSLTLANILKSYRHLLLYGEAGIGKTEMMAYLLLTYARQEVATRLRLDQNLIPVSLAASTLVRAVTPAANLSLSTFLFQHLQPPTKTYVDNRLSEGQFLILIDEFDPLSTAEIQMVMAWLDREVQQWPKNRVLILARPHLAEWLGQPGAFTLAYFSRFEADAIKALAKRWRIFIPEALPILSAITQEEDVYDLAHNPLHLLMLLIVGLTTRNLPAHTAQLYADYLNVVLTRGMSQEIPLPGFSETDKRIALQKIALKLHQSHQIYLEEPALSLLVRQAVPHPESALRDTEQFLVDLIIQSGLITRESGQCRFVQFSFQEFLTAQAPEIDRLGQANLPLDPWWQGVRDFYQELTNANYVMDQVFTEKTNDLMNIDANRAYTLSLLMQNVNGFEEAHQKVEPASSRSANIFEFDPPDADSNLAPIVETDGTPIKIMVVDDTPQNLQLARFILQRENYTVIEASSATEALEVIQQNKPSLILSDIQMPGIDGYEFCRRLKADPETQNIPFIFVTAFSRSTKEAARGLQIGADDYITRPFAPEELLARIGANVRIHQAEEAARRQATILARRNRELALLNQIQQAVTASLNLDDVLDATMKQVQKVLKAEATSLWFVDRANDVLLLSAAFNDSARAIHGLRQPLYEGIPGYVVRSGQVFLSGDVQTHSEYKLSPIDRNDYPIRSMLCVPLQVREQVIGVLQAVHHDPDHFNQEDLKLLNAVGDAVTVAIENAWLFGQIQLFNQQLERKVEARTYELAREKEKTETILISIADGLLVIDHDNRIAMANRAAEELLKFNLSDTIGLSIDRDEFNTPLWDFVRYVNAQPDATYTATTDVTNPQNIESLLSIQAHSAKMLSPSDKSISGTVIVLRDITALQEVDRMKARFMAGITHELKTPIAIMTLHTGSLLKYKTLDEEKKLGMLQTIQRQAQLLERLVENILELSRLDSGTLRLQREPVDLLELTRQVVSELEPLARGKGLQLNFASTEKVVMIEADDNQLERVIRNLVDNAIKYTPQGGIKVSVTTNREASPHGEALLQVADTGIGLTKEQRDKLFERFYRADPSHNIPGTGLGLSIAKEITKRHNGDIAVESMPGQGSTFTVYLPLMK